MLFPVTVYNANGKVKEVISKERLHRRHWKIFQDNEKLPNFQSAEKAKISKVLKAQLDMEFPQRSLGYQN